MTLHEKFHQWLRTEPFNSRDRPTLREAKCVEIADEFAVDFAEYCLVIFGRLRDNEITIEEALELYKKERGL